MTAFDPQYGRSVPVADGIHRISANNPGPFTGAGTNTYILGTDEVMVVDPGPNDPAHVEAIVSAVAGRPVSHILITHTHKDHVAALPALKQAIDAPTVGEGPHRTARPLRPGEENPFIGSSDTSFAPDIALGDGESVANGSLTVSAIATPGHAANHLVFCVGDMCLSGDHVMGWSTSVIAPPEGNMAQYLASLDKMLGERHAKYFPGHGPAIHEPHKIVTAMRSHRLMREAAILETVRAGDTHIMAIVDALYEGLAPALRNAAALSVYAHLEKLQEEGRVARQGETPTSLWTAL